MDLKNKRNSLRLNESDYKREREDFKLKAGVCGLFELNSMLIIQKFQFFMFRHFL